MADPETTAVMEFTLQELQMLFELVNYRKMEPYWAPSYKEFVESVGKRLEAEIARIKTPVEEAEILRKADEIRARRAAKALEA